MIMIYSITLWPTLRNASLIPTEKGRERERKRERKRERERESVIYTPQPLIY